MGSLIGRPVCQMDFCIFKVQNRQVEIHKNKIKLDSQVTAALTVNIHGLFVLVSI